MAITLDAALGTFTQNTGATSISLTTTSAVAADARIIVATYVQGVTATTVTGGSLAWVVDYQLGLSGTNRVCVCSAWAPGGLATSTVITVNYSGAPSNNGLICAASFTGNNIVFDKGTFGTGAGTAAWSGSLTPSAPALVYAVSCIDSSTTTTNAPTTGTEVHDFWGTGVNRSFATEYAIDATAASQTLSGTFSGNTGSSFNIITLASYIEAPALPLPVHLPFMR